MATKSFKTFDEALAAVTRRLWAELECQTVALSPRRQLEAHFGYRPTSSRPHVGSWTGLNCGDTVCRTDDERHEGRLQAIHPQGCTVRWSNGWLEYEIALEDLRRVS